MPGVLTRLLLPVNKNYQFPALTTRPPWDIREVLQEAQFIKKDCLNGRYYRTHQQFQAAILDSLEAVNTRHQPTLKTTLTLNFQMFDNAQLLAM